jgi:hypothetical protein
MTIPAQQSYSDAPPLLDVFLSRCEARAILVANYQMKLCDAVDGLWAAAEAYGLVRLLGADAVQHMLAAAFERCQDDRC